MNFSFRFARINQHCNCCGLCVPATFAGSVWQQQVVWVGGISSSQRAGCCWCLLPSSFKSMKNHNELFEKLVVRSFQPDIVDVYL